MPGCLPPEMIDRYRFGTLDAATELPAVEAHCEQVGALLCGSSSFDHLPALAKDRLWRSFEPHQRDPWNDAGIPRRQQQTSALQDGGGQDVRAPG